MGKARARGQRHSHLQRWCPLPWVSHSCGRGAECAPFTSKEAEPQRHQSRRGPTAANSPPAWPGHLARPRAHRVWALPAHPGSSSHWAGGGSRQDRGSGSCPRCSGRHAGTGSEPGTHQGLAGCGAGTESHTPGASYCAHLGPSPTQPWLQGLECPWAWQQWRHHPASASGTTSGRDHPVPGRSTSPLSSLTPPPPPTSP